jgi:hypothetical protein
MIVKINVDDDVNGRKRKYVKKEKRDNVPRKKLPDS